jgi:hypothetical protein
MIYHEIVCLKMFASFLTMKSESNLNVNNEIKHAIFDF